MAERVSVAQQAMDALERTLAKRPGLPLRWNRTRDSLEIAPQAPEGFSVTIYDEAGEALVAANRWHAHFDDPAEAAYCAFWLLTPFYRVVHELKAGVLVAAWIERYGQHGWEPMEPVYFLNPEDAPSWKLQGDERFVRAYFTQNALPLDRPFTDVVPGATLADDGLPPGTVLGRSAVESLEPLAPSLLDL
ncbi:MAG: hypothetical protein N2109_01160 [Fimbriimonadales bacterium]|nr:hypothetical protein [Fimbriimonadales bacterium]